MGQQRDMTLKGDVTMANGQVEGRKGDTLCGTTPLTKKGLGESVHFVVISKTPGYYLPRSPNTFLSPFFPKVLFPPRKQASDSSWFSFFLWMDVDSVA